MCGSLKYSSHQRRAGTRQLRLMLHALPAAGLRRADRPALRRAAQLSECMLRCELCGSAGPDPHALPQQARMFAGCCAAGGACLRRSGAAQRHRDRAQSSAGLQTCWHLIVCW